MSSGSRGSRPPLGATRASAGRIPPTSAIGSRSRFRFFGGKGGVGKTTCAAGAALVAADSGARVLLVSTDPAHSLGHAFDQPFTAVPRRIRVAGPRDTRGTRRTPARGTLDVVELDADRALARWIGERRVVLKQIVGRGTYLDDDDIDALLRLAFPGVDELIGLIELTRLAQSGHYPEVVVDTAPTGHTLRLLAMPSSLKRIADILEQMQAKHRYLSESLAGRYRSDAGDLAIGEIDARARALEALLRDPRQCAFHWITLPEAVAIEEARDGIAALTASGISVKELIVNRVTALPRGACAVCEARVACEAPMIAQAHALFPGIPVRLVPTLSEEPRGSVSLRRGRALSPPSVVRAAGGPSAACGKARSS